MSSEKTSLWHDINAHESFSFQLVELPKCESCNSLKAVIMKIGHDSTNHTYEIFWEEYLAYSMRDERYVERAPQELFGGNTLGYSKNSYFEEYVRRAIPEGILNSHINTSVKFMHLSCVDQIIDIACFDEPKISRMLN